MTMRATVKWLDGAAFVGESGSGHAMVIDGAPAAGGRNIGPRPLETMLIGLGACSAFDVVLILRKSRQTVTDCRVELEAERADAVPAVFTRIHMVFVVSGTELRESAVRRAVDLSPRSTAPPPPCCVQPSRSPTSTGSSPTEPHPDIHAAPGPFRTGYGLPDGLSRMSATNMQAT